MALEIPMEPTSLWHRMMRSKYGIQQYGQDASAGLAATHANPWKFISQVYPSISPLLSLCWGGKRFRSWEDHWMGDSSFIRSLVFNSCPLLAPLQFTNTSHMDI